MVSCPPGLPEGVSTRELAEGYASVLEETGPADVMGLSLGGFVVQRLAADRPERPRAGRGPAELPRPRGGRTLAIARDA